MKLIFTTIFIVFVALFPLNVIADNYPTNIILKFSLLTGYYYLPILLYCFLLYILFDITLLVNRIVKFIPKNTLVSQKFRMIVLCVIFLATAAIEIKGIYNFNNTEIHKYNIGISKKSGKLEYLKIALAADIHLSEITNKYFINQFIEKINSINPDIVILAGDIVESDQSNPKMKHLKEQLSNIRSKYGVYAIEGNHELYGRGSKFDFFKNSNITILRDSVIKIENSFYLIGRKDRHDRNRKSIEDLLAYTSDSLPCILLNHQPYNLEMAYNNNIDVQVSGHTHYGQLFPINLIIESLYELSWGYKKIKNTHFFVTCGAQGWGPQVKTASNSEIMGINIDFKNK